MNICEFSVDKDPPSDSARISPAGSRLHRFVPGDFHSWTGVPLQEYKPAADHHCGVLRSVLIGNGGEQTRFHLRYFEIAPGGFTTLEHHRHEHVVVVLRGQGIAHIADTEHRLTFGDTLYIAPHEVHQLRNASASEPFGFLCLVDAVRDRPIPVDADSTAEPTCELP
jgi:ribulose-bisphosphate carboxylase large chain